MVRRRRASTISAWQEGWRCSCFRRQDACDEETSGIRGAHNVVAIHDQRAIRFERDAGKTGGRDVCNGSDTDDGEIRLSILDGLWRFHERAPPFVWRTAQALRKC